MKKIFFNDEIFEAIKKIMKKAKRECIFVTPFLDLEDFNTCKELLSFLKKKRDIKLTFFIQKKNSEYLPPKNYPEICFNKSIDFLKEKNISIYSIPNLHAKLYIADNKMITTSYNLNRHAKDKNFEIGTILKGKKYILKTKEKLNQLEQYKIIGTCNDCRKILIFPETVKKDSTEANLCIDCWKKIHIKNK